MAAAAERIEDDAALAALGRALAERTGDVLELVATRGGRTPTEEVPASVRAALTSVWMAATAAVAQWVAGEASESRLHADRETRRTFSELASHPEARLNEITKRCLWWRDAVSEVLVACAQELQTPPHILARARALTQMMLDVTLVRVGEAFESQRVRTQQELDRRQEEVAYLATHDALTGLPNRELVVDRGERMLSRGRRRGTPVAALAVGIDSLGAIGETLGHGVAEDLIGMIAQRLDGLVRDVDALGRTGPEEFAILAEDLPGPDGAELIAERLIAALAEPFQLESSRELILSASVGVATGQLTGAEDLLRDAEIAMRRARSLGGGRSIVFEEGMEDVAQTRMELELELRGALANRELFLVYQPTFDLSELVPTGVESLLRWRRREHGVVSPADFIPVLEETGLIVEVGGWVLREACAQCAGWRRAGHRVGVAVNVSARQLDTDRFVEDVRTALVDSGLDAEALTLEITETTIMRDAEETAGRLRELKEIGVRVAIDDFGTGYSSLSHLQRFPVDALKIDRSFIAQLGGSPEAETLVRTLVQLGRALSIETLAEGIEQQSELALLRRERCNSGQGFLFAHPLEAGAAGDFLDSWRRSPRPGTLPQLTSG